MIEDIQFQRMLFSRRSYIRNSPMGVLDFSIYRSKMYVLHITTFYVLSFMSLAQNWQSLSSWTVSQRVQFVILIFILHKCEKHRCCKILEILNGILWKQLLFHMCFISATVFIACKYICSYYFCQLLIAITFSKYIKC